MEQHSFQSGQWSNRIYSQNVQNKSLSTKRSYLSKATQYMEDKHLEESSLEVFFYLLMHNIPPPNLDSTTPINENIKRHVKT